jgi:thiol:disulfide interchange protein
MSLWTKSLWTNLGTTWVFGAMVLCIAGCSPRPTGMDVHSHEWDSHTQGLPFVFGYEQGMAQARQTGKPAMLFVTTTWCGWCKKLAKESFRDEEIRSLLTKHFVCVIVDGDSDTVAKRKYGVRGYPHVIFVTPDGNKLDECRGYVPADRFRRIVQGAINRA